MDGKLYYTFKAPKAGRPVLRAREHLSGSRPDEVARGRAEEGRARTGRSLLPSPALFVRRARTARTCSSATRSSRCSSSTTSASCSTVTTTSTSGSSRRTGFVYFVEGSSGQLRTGDLRPGLTAHRVRQRHGRDVHADGDRAATTLTFNAISQHRHGHRLRRHRPPEVGATLQLSGSSPRPARGSAAKAASTLFFFQSDSKTASIFRTMAPSLDDDADFAPALELELAQALAADERRSAVADRWRARAAAGRQLPRTSTPGIVFSSLPMIRISTPARRAPPAPSGSRCR